MRRSVAVVGMLALSAAPAAGQTVLGSDAEACTAGLPAIRVAITGLKDRTGRLKLELYPATEDDFLKDDTALAREGKTFRRVWAATPPRGEIAMCIRAPAAGRYALLVTHDRDGRNKFDFWRDGAGFPDNARLGRRRPKLAQAVVDVPRGGTSVSVRIQYLRGLSGFGPVTD